MTLVSSGTCCACGGPLLMIGNLVLLDVKKPGRGGGWGCVVCNLPADGAVAVVCEDCEASGKPIRFACSGYPADGGRVPIEALTVPHRHDMTIPHDDPEIHDGAPPPPQAGA